MKTSESGASILGGSGLKTVWDHIERSFTNAREIGPTSLLQTRPKDAIAPSQLLIAPKPSKPSQPLRPLAELALPILQEIHATGISGYKNTQDCWDIGDELHIKEAPELFDAALAVLGYQSEEIMLSIIGVKI